jgi:hypothetical protein
MSRAGRVTSSVTATTHGFFMEVTLYVPYGYTHMQGTG